MTGAVRGTLHVVGGSEQGPFVTVLVDAIPEWYWTPEATRAPMAVLALTPEAQVERVERVARALLERGNLGEGSFWDRAPEATRDWYRALAAAALAAMGVGA